MSLPISHYSPANFNIIYIYIHFKRYEGIARHTQKRSKYPLPPASSNQQPGNNPYPQNAPSSNQPASNPYPTLGGNSYPSSAANTKPSPINPVIDTAPTSNQYPPSGTNRYPAFSDNSGPAPSTYPVAAPPIKPTTASATNPAPYNNPSNDYNNPSNDYLQNLDDLFNNNFQAFPSVPPSSVKQAPDNANNLPPPKNNNDKPFDLYGLFNEQAPSANIAAPSTNLAAPSANLALVNYPASTPAPSSNIPGVCKYDSLFKLNEFHSECCLC
uniref:Uncharacterized protein n=1 Tax=Biomphalaria glabrata TaxID=6526 RepID=A0A2C9LQF6_BIOGL